MGVRWRVASVLGEIKSQQAVPALIRALENDQDEHVRRAAIYALNDLNPQGLVFLIYLKLLLMNH